MTNPYEPVLESDDTEDSLLSTDAFFTFDGVIEQRDYALLLPNRSLLFCLQIVLLVTLAPALCIGLFMAIAMVAMEGLSLESLVTIGVVTGLAVVATITFLAIGRKWRSNRYLKRFPDLLGVVRGEFTDKGLLVNDGKRQHWFGPSHLATADISRAGIRVPLTGHPYRYLAFTSRLMKMFSPAQAKDLQTLWRKKAARISRTEPNPVANLWAKLTAAPERSVAFKGYCTVNEPFKSTETRQAAIIESISALGMLGFAGYLAKDSNFMSWGALMFAVLGGVSSVLAWRKYLYGTIERSWFQYGWVSETEVGVCNNEIGVVFDRGELAKVESSDEAVVLTTHSQTRLYIFREQVVDETSWQHLKTLVASEALGSLTSQPSPHT
jgi:hypothetical protein